MPLTADDKLAILELFARFSYAIDAADGEAWAATFTPDGVFEHKEGRVVGTSDLRRLVEEGAELPPRQHWIGNILIDGDGDNATATSYGFVASGPNSDGTFTLVRMAQAENRLQRLNGQWLFAERKGQQLGDYVPTARS